MSSLSAATLAQIPASDATVNVSIIDTSSFVDMIETSIVMSPQIGKHKYIAGPCYSFLIHHQPSNTRLLYDLGIRKDYETGYPPFIPQFFKDYGWKITAPTDVATILTENGVSLDSIEAIIWSHPHWDHVGDPATFPNSTSLIVGPGFKKEFLPPYPERADSMIEIQSIANRDMIELDFTRATAVQIGPYRALDYFGDGSFYILDTPGHTVGHISALARTTTGDEPTYIFMGGDIAHHCGEFRPSAQLPLPEQITPDPRQPPYQPTPSLCPCSIFTHLHPSSSSATTTSFYRTGGADDVALAQTTVDHLAEFDGSPNVLTVIAHDNTLKDVLEYFPESANGWKSKGWRTEGLWRFLADFITDREGEGEKKE